MTSQSLILCILAPSGAAWIRMRPSEVIVRPLANRIAAPISERRNAPLPAAKSEGELSATAVRTGAEAGSDQAAGESSKPVDAFLIAYCTAIEVRSGRKFSDLEPGTHHANHQHSGDDDHQRRTGCRKQRAGGGSIGKANHNGRAE